MNSRNWPGSALPVLVLEHAWLLWGSQRSELRFLRLSASALPPVISQTDPSAEIMLRCFFVHVHACIVCVCVHVCAHERARTCMCATNHYVNIVIHFLGIHRVLVTRYPVLNSAVVGHDGTGRPVISG